MNAQLTKEHRKFWSIIAGKYDEVVDLQTGVDTREMVRSRLRQEARLGAVAEFGCGTGFFTQVLAEEGGYSAGDGFGSWHARGGQAENQSRERAFSRARLPRAVLSRFDLRRSLHEPGDSFYRSQKNRRRNASHSQARWPAHHCKR